MLSIARSPRMSPSALAMVLLVHVVVLGGMASLRQAPVEPPVPMVSALMVEVIRPQVEPRKVTSVVPPKPVPVPVPRQVRSRPVPVPPVLSTQNQAAAQVPDVPKATPQTLPMPTTPAAQGAPVAVAAAAAPPTTTTAPRFDADYLDNPKPAYPPLSRRANEQGKVVLKVLVEPSGAPSQVEVRTSSGFERLDKSAVAAVSRWKFIPAKQGSEVVSAWVAVPIVFSLKD